ncbi:MAG: hypothetical protein HRT45_19325 [Bdellovibrionales bacterium]|nr:hypothetical protein [Bdellovibrionales bacterium]
MSIFRNKLAQIGVLSICVILPIAALSKPVKLKPLASNKILSWDRKTENGAELFVFFQPDCLSCRQQARDLSCLKDTVTIRYVSFGFGDAKVREEAIRMGVVGKAFQVSREGLKRYGFLEPLTPQSALFVGENQINWLGYKTCSAIKKNFEREGSDEAT